MKANLKIGDLYFIFLNCISTSNAFEQYKTLDNCSSHFKVKNTPSEFALTKQILIFSSFCWRVVQGVHHPGGHFSNQGQSVADYVTPLGLLFVPNDFASLLSVGQAVVAPNVLHVVKVSTNLHKTKIFNRIVF
jgi:hypothetical protein